MNDEHVKVLLSFIGLAALMTMRQSTRDAFMTGLAREIAGPPKKKNRKKIKTVKRK